jgi:pimeloyl-ACP methyl ester carboxylesterase
MVIQGDGDAVTGPATGPALAEAIPGTRLVTLAGAGHIPNARDPVQVNLLIRDFVAGLEVAT